MRILNASSSISDFSDIFLRLIPRPHLFQMDSTETETEFRIPTPPPLRNRDPNNYAPFRIFAFPLPDDHLVKWAKKHIITSETDPWNLAQDAWNEISRRRPQKGWCRSTLVYYAGGGAGLALMIANNRSSKEMAQAQDIELIQEYRDFLEADPGGFVCSAAEISSFK